jgi:hypothetical protein
MSRPDALLLAKDPNELLYFATHPHGLALVPGANALPSYGPRGIWLVDADCGNDTLNDPALSAYMNARVPITLHAERARDLRPFLRRKAAFEARGYRIETIPPVGGK